MADAGACQLRRSPHPITLTWAEGVESRTQLHFLLLRPRRFGEKIFPVRARSELLAI